MGDVVEIEDAGERHLARRRDEADERHRRSADAVIEAVRAADPRVDGPELSRRANFALAELGAGARLEVAVARALRSGDGLTDEDPPLGVAILLAGGTPGPRTTRVRAEMATPRERLGAPRGASIEHVLKSVTAAEMAEDDEPIDVEPSPWDPEAPAPPPTAKPEKKARVSIALAAPPRDEELERLNAVEPLARKVVRSPGVTAIRAPKYSKPIPPSAPKPWRRPVITGAPPAEPAIVSRAIEALAALGPGSFLPYDVALRARADLSAIVAALETASTLGRCRRVTAGRFIRWELT